MMGSCKDRVGIVQALVVSPVSTTIHPRFSSMSRSLLATGGAVLRLRRRKRSKRRGKRRGRRRRRRRGKRKRRTRKKKMKKIKKKMVGTMKNGDRWARGV